MMMRKILFRGKRIDNGEWMEGYYTKWSDGSASILPHAECIRDVIPETVGQCTGLVDKNGRKIFEDDLVDVTLPATNAQPEFSWGVCKVIFAEGCFGVLTRSEFVPFRSFAPRVEFEVVGNVCDKEENRNV